MSVFIKKHSVSYYPAPKCACTSLKHLAFKLENDFDFRIFHINGVMMHIHSLYASLGFDRSRSLDTPTHARITVVRDPIDRFLSAYGNRVLHHNELSEARIRDGGSKLDLKPRPDLGELVDNLENYRLADVSIKHHTDPLTYFLGTDPAYYDRIFALHQIHDLVKWLEGRTGGPLVLAHEQRGGKKFHRSDLSSAQIARLQQFYAADYESLGAYF